MPAHPGAYPSAVSHVLNSSTTSGHVTSLTWDMYFTHPSVPAHMEMQRHLTTIKTVTIAATSLLINFLTSRPGRGLNLD